VIMKALRMFNLSLLPRPLLKNVKIYAAKVEFYVFIVKAKRIIPIAGIAA
jgi:hypothetical protein